MDEVTELHQNGMQVAPINIFDIDISITIGEEGEADFVTEQINGLLQAMIISTTAPICIKILFAELPDVVLYETRNFVEGSRYLPLRVSPIDFRDEKFNFGPMEWAINNSLKIEIIGKPGTVVNITKRCKYG